MNRAGDIALTLVFAFSTTLHAQTSSRDLSTIPAAELAGSYRDLVQIETMLGMVEGGGTLQLPERTVTRDNLEQFKADLAYRMAALHDAITKRGSANVTGTYGAKANSACEKVPSGWAQGIEAGYMGGVTISQEGFVVTLVQEFTYEGVTDTFEIPAVIVESTLALDDMMNSDFGFTGEVAGGTITFRPHVNQILAAWPDWLKAPNRRDLSRCEVTLVPTTS